MATHHDIANAILKADDIREKSHYEKDWGTACEEACEGNPDILDLVYIASSSGDADIWTWAEKYKTKS